jgi:hypothetical protein
MSMLALSALSAAALSALLAGHSLSDGSEGYMKIYRKTLGM